MADHERYQTACRVCFRVFEADTVEQVINNAMRHEQDPKAHKLNMRNTRTETNDEIHSTT